MARIQVRLQDGRIGTIEDNEFDPNSMQAIPEPTPTPTTTAAPKGNLSSNVGKGLMDFLGNLVKPEIDAVNQTLQENAQLPDTKGDLLGSILKAGKATGNLAKNTVGNYKIWADAGSYAVPFGKAAQGANIAQRAATKVILPGAAAGGLQGIAQEDATPESVVGNAALGAGGASALLGGSKVLSKILGSGGNVLNKAGNAVTRSQYNTGSRMAEKENLGQTVEELANYGIRNIEDVTKIAPLVTGDTGAITQITRNAVSKAKPVEIGGIMNKAKELLDSEPLISAATAKKFNNIISKSIMSTSGDNIAGGDPRKMFDFVQTLESKGASLSRGNDESRALGGVYKNVARDIKERLFKGAGADAALGEGAITQEALEQLAQVSPKLAEAVAGAKNIKDLRSIAAPFVRGSKLAAETANRQDNKILTTQDLGAGGIGALAAGGPGFLTGMLATKALGSNKGKAMIGDTLAKFGNVSTPNSGNQILDMILGQTGARGATSMTGPQVEDSYSNNNTEQTESKLHNEILPQADSNVNSENKAKLVKQALAIAMMQDLANGGKNIPELKAISDAIGEAYGEDQKAKKYSEGDKKFLLAKNEANKAMRLLDGGKVSSGKLASAKSGVEEFLGVQDPNTTEFKAQLATARTAARNALLGANMSDKEMESYLDAIFSYSNEPQIIKAKLQTFINSMNDYENSVAGQTSDQGI